MRAIYIILVLIPCLSFVSKAQQSNLGLMPSLTLSYKIGKGWKLISKLEERSFVSPDSDRPFVRHQLVDVNTFLSKRTGAKSSLAAGLQLRIQNGVLLSSFAQQWTLKDKYGGIDISHRLGTDLLLFDGQGYKVRGRYRFVGLIPFSGKSIDIKEWYLKSSLEGLLALTEEGRSAEFRMAFLFGKGFSEELKLEIGPEFRQKLDNTRSLWTRMSLYKSF